MSEPSLARLYDVVHSSDKVFMVMEFLDLDLKNYLNREPEGLPPLLIKVGWPNERLFIPLVLRLPNAARSRFLSQSSSSSQRSQTTKSSH